MRTLDQALMAGWHHPGWQGGSNRRTHHKKAVSKAERPLLLPVLDGPWPVQHAQRRHMGAQCLQGLLGHLCRAREGLERRSGCALKRQWAAARLFG